MRSLQDAQGAEASHSMDTQCISAPRYLVAVKMRVGMAVEEGFPAPD